MWSNATNAPCTKLTSTSDQQTSGVVSCAVKSSPLNKCCSFIFFQITSKCLFYDSIVCLQVFFQGDSRDCRERVKALNELKNRNEQKSDQEKLENHFIQNNQQTGRFQESTINSSGSCEHSDTVEEPRVKESKWAKYLTNWDDENNYLY